MMVKTRKTRKVLNDLLKPYSFSHDLERRVEKLAMEYNFYSNACQQSNEDTRIAVIIYIALQDYKGEKRNPAEKSFSISDLLSKSDSNIVDFISTFWYLHKIHHIKPPVIQKLLLIQKKYCIDTAMYSKFQSLFKDVFRSLESCKERFEANRQMIWLLFLVAKTKAHLQLNTLMDNLNLLLCCMAYVLSKCPTYLVDYQFNGVLSMCNRNSLPVVSHLIKFLKMPSDQVQIIYNTSWLPIQRELFPNNQKPEFQILSSMYRKIYEANADFDESLFLDDNKHLRAKPNPPVSESSFEESNDTSSVQFSNINNLKAISLPELSKSHFKKFGALNPEANIQAVLKECLLKFVRTYCTDSGSSQEEGRHKFHLASQMYLLLLRQMLSTEEDSGVHLLTILNYSVFNTALLGCCLEVAISDETAILKEASPNHSRATVKFPWILKILGIHALNFFKTVETIRKHQSHLTTYMIQHLEPHEEKIMQEWGWSSDSPIYNLLKSSRPLATSSDPHITWEDESINDFLVCDNRGLNIFMNHVGKRCYKHILHFAHTLKFSEKLVETIWATMEEILYQRESLFVNRNLDQILLCTFYAITKVYGIQLKFRDIFTVYKSLPYTNSLVYRKVLISGTRQESLVEFYNDIYVPTMKDYVMPLYQALQKEKQTISQSIRISPSTGDSLIRENIFVGTIDESIDSTDLNSSTSSFQSFTFDRTSTPNSAKLRSFNTSLKVNFRDSLKRSLPSSDGGTPPKFACLSLNRSSISPNIHKI